MKRFISVVAVIEENHVWKSTIEKETTSFEEECSQAIICGYTPAGSLFSYAKDIDGDFDEGSGHLRNEDAHLCMIQHFYDPEGAASWICSHCAKCESCTDSPNKDHYCEQFEEPEKEEE